MSFQPISVAQGSTTAGEAGPLVQGAVTTAAPSYTNGQTDPLSLTPAGALRVDGSATTQPVTGTLAVTLPVGQAVELLDSGGVNKASISAAGAVKVDGSAVTQPVSNAGLTNIDVALSTRTKPSDQQHTIIDSGTTVVTQPTGTNLHVVVDTAATTPVLTQEVLQGQTSVPELLNLILLELRAIRMLETALLCDDNRYRPQDFVSASFQSEINSETVIN